MHVEIQTHKQQTLPPAMKHSLSPKHRSFLTKWLSLSLFLAPLFIFADTKLQTVEGEMRDWTFRNGDVQQLQLKNAYGKTVYFADKNGSTTFANILALIPDDQAEIVYWSRVRDAQIFEPSTDQTSFEKQFKRDAFRLEDEKLIKNEWNESQRDPEFYAIYTSASWCKPCRGFTPSLVSFYNTTKDFYQGQYEVVLCSWDQSQSEMIDYMIEDGMPWYGNWKSRKSNFWRKYQGNGMPCLVIVDRNGFVLAHSYNSEGYLGPTSALKRFREILMHAYGTKEDRISVPTPGIDLKKLNEALKKRKDAAEKARQSSAPSIAYGPKELFKSLEEEDAESIDIKTKLSISNRGMVTKVELLNSSNPALEREISKAVMLWQFIPALSSEGEENSAVVSLPLKLKLKDKYLTEELSLLK